MSPKAPNLNVRSCDTKGVGPPTKRSIQSSQKRDEQPASSRRVEGAVDLCAKPGLATTMAELDELSKRTDTICAIIDPSGSYRLPVAKPSTYSPDNPALRTNLAALLAAPNVDPLARRAARLAEEALRRKSALEADIERSTRALHDDPSPDHAAPAGQDANQLSEDVLKGPLITVSLLRPHPNNLNLFGSVSDSERLALHEDVRSNGVNRPIIITGNNCWSPPGTVLCGHRRLEAAMEVGLTEVPFVVRDGLSKEDEQMLMIRANLGDTLGRKMKQSQLAKLQTRLAELTRIGQGTRTDLQAKHDRGRTTWGVVAEQTGSGRTTTIARQKVFSSPVSTGTLKDAVDAGKIGVNRAAEILRGVEQQFLAPANARRDDTTTSHPIAPTAYAEVERRLKAHLDQKAVPKKRSSPSAEEIVVQLEEGRGGLHGNTTLNGRDATFTIRDNDLKLVITLGRRTKT